MSWNTQQKYGFMNGQDKFIRACINVGKFEEAVSRIKIVDAQVPDGWQQSWQVIRVKFIADMMTSMTYAFPKEAKKLVKKWRLTSQKQEKEE